MNNEYEESIKKEFEAVEGISVEATEEKTTDLGSVDPNRMKRVTADDPEIRRIQELTGYIRLDLNLLPSAGLYYRHDLEIHIRAARVGEIRNFSTIDETNPKDVDDKLNSILASCTKVKYGNQHGSYKDILEEDRVYIILSIRELTFKDGEAKLMMPVNKKNCFSSTCKKEESVELKVKNLLFQKVDSSIEKYYNEENRCYSIQTKNYGIIDMAPPTIGVMRALTDYARDKENNNSNWDKSLLAILPYLQREWRGLDEKAIFSIMVDLQGWDVSKFSLVYRIAEMMRIGIESEMVNECNTCGAEVTVPLTFPGGIKSLFIIQNIDSQLL